MTGEMIPAGKYALEVLYLDNHLLAVVKPSNLPVQADSSGDLDALSACKAYIGQKFHKPGNVYLGLVHRLDRPVGGVMVFARTSKAAARLSEQFSARTAQKRYLAVVEGSLSGEEMLVDALYKDERGFVRVARDGEMNARRAELRYRAIASREGTTLLSVHLMTGRAHQIRVQLMNAGHPIVFDARYGEAAPGNPIALWAESLVLSHPTTRETVRFAALPPPRAPFLTYSDLLEELPIE